jgi:hypothetical protein
MMKTESKSFPLLSLFTQRFNDPYLDVLVFLGVKDSYRFSIASMSCSLVFHDEKLWINYCSTSLSAVRGLSFERLRSMKEFMFYPSYYFMYYTLKDLKCSLFGYFQSIPLAYSRDYCKGGLFRISSNQSVVFCVQINDNGEEISEWKWFFRFDVLSKSLNLLNFADSAKFFEVGFCVKTLILDRISDSPIKSLLSMAFEKIPEIIYPPLLSGVLSLDCRDVLQDCQGCLGLFTSTYSSHGTEILHLSLQTITRERFPFPGFDDFGSVALIGLKITGDRNVPAGQPSFVVDIMNRNHDYSPPEIPTVVFPGNSKAEPRIIDWQTRKPFLQFSSSGYGQINVIPFDWNPEWIKCEFLVYKEPIEADETVFTMIWRDEDFSGMDHALDFSFLPNWKAKSDQCNV